MTSTKIDPKLQAPTGEPSPSASTGPKKQKQQRRYRLFDDDGGDYRLYVISAGDGGMPKGALIPVPDVPGFLSTADAKKFVRDSGDLFSNKQLMVLKAIEILRVDVEVKPTVKISFKPRKQISGPPAKE